MSIGCLKKIRESFYSKWSWWLLLLTFALTFFLPERKDARNLYRLLVALPVLLMLSGPVLKDFFASKSMRWFAVLSLYFSISLLWGVEPNSIDNHLIRVLSVWGFAFLLYNVAHFRPELFVQIDKVLVGFGLIWIVLLVADWSSLWLADPSLDRWTVHRGVFTHHLQVGWMLAVLTLISLQRIFRQTSRRYCWVAITILFFVLLVLTQARGGLLVLVAGVITWLLIHLRNLKVRLIATIGFGLLCVAGVIFVFNPEMLNSLVERGVAGRFTIWQNWYDTWSSSVVNMVFGYGLGAPTENMIKKFTAAHYHNLYLNTLFYGGVVGFGLAVGWFSSLVKSVWRDKWLDSSWVPVVVGMLAGFLTDGDKFFNYPGAFVFCFILPVFCLSFGTEITKTEKPEARI